jgi:YbbR domain-containing protein
MTFRTLILDQFRWKLISVVLALLIWLRVNDAVETERSQPTLPAEVPRTSSALTLSLPVRVLGPARLPRGFVVVPDEVTVTLQGETSALKPANATNIVAYVEAVFPAEVKWAKLPVVVRPPAGVTVGAIHPPEVFVERM